MAFTEDRVLLELRKVGLNVASIFDLVNTKEKYPEAIPILVQLAKKDYADPRVLDGVIRALTVKEAKGAANETLLKVYARLASEHELVRWSIGNAFSVIITPKDVDQVLQIVQDKSSGMSRQMFVIALGGFRNSPKIESVLIQLLDDEEVVLHAIKALTKLRSQRARPHLENLSNSPRSVIRQAVKHYLKVAAKRSV
jgi:HEAT repeat protein